MIFDAKKTGMCCCACMCCAHVSSGARRLKG